MPANRLNLGRRQMVDVRGRSVLEQLFSEEFDPLITVLFPGQVVV